MAKAFAFGLFAKFVVAGERGQVVVEAVVERNAVQAQVRAAPVRPARNRDARTGCDRATRCGTASRLGHIATVADGKDIAGVVGPGGRRDVAGGEQLLVDRQLLIARGRHEHDVDQSLPGDLANLLAILGQRAEPALAGMHLGRLARHADAKRHIGILGIGQNEVGGARRIGMDGRQLAIERFLHDGYLPWSRASTPSSDCLRTWPLLRSAWISLGQRSSSIVEWTPLRPTTVGTEMATSRKP